MNLFFKEMYVYVLLFQDRNSPMRWHHKATILTNLILEKIDCQMSAILSAIIVYSITLTTKYRIFVTRKNAILSRYKKCDKNALHTDDILTIKRDINAIQNDDKNALQIDDNIAI